MKATDLPELRDELARWMSKPESIDVLTQLNGRRGWMGSDHISDESIAACIAWERAALRVGELFFVNEDMTSLAIAAGRTLPGFTLQANDLPAESGLCLFAQGIDSRDPKDANDAYVEVQGFSWYHGSVKFIDSARTSGLYVVTYNLRATTIQRGLADGTMDSDYTAWLQRQIPELVHHGELFIPFDRHHDIPDSDDTAMATYGRTLLATWLLMQQPGLTSTSDHEYTKLDKARLKRQRRKPERVHVIQLRRPAHDRHSGPVADRHYDHRWAVRGHWRKQWYPSRNDHQPIWIAPHIKGPEGAPLKTGEKVYAWVR
ncbi:hypothetical protein [Enterococcus hirae]|uniref:hypothetical protein n=1 Tax=Enterococcus hirae TaxID=1354 RepID=UPI001367FC04|nr:hypothetical protein [Enterococcus hirae]NAE18036.1 hypothetical protein [Enterococcus hirae]